MAQLSRAGCAIVGVGVTRQGRNLGIPERELRREALELALADAGLRRGDIDGYVACHGTVAFEDLRYLGLGPLFSWSLSSGGATGFTALVEGLLQLRGEGGATQVAGAEVALVSGHGGNGGVQNTWAHATALLGRGL